MNNKRKGCGKYQNNTITLEQRHRLLKWCELYKDIKPEDDWSWCASEAEIDLNFRVTPSVLRNHWQAVHGKAKVKPSSAEYWRVLAINRGRRIEQLEGRKCS